MLFHQRWSSWAWMTRLAKHIEYQIHFDMNKIKINKFLRSQVKVSLSKVPKFTAMHLDPEGKRKMRVKLATQILNVIRYCSWNWTENITQNSFQIFKRFHSDAGMSFSMYWIHFRCHYKMVSLELHLERMIKYSVSTLYSCIPSSKLNRIHQ